MRLLASWEVVALVGLALIAQGPQGQQGPGGRPTGEDGRRELYALMRFEAERAQGWFASGTALARLLDRRSAACVLAMAGIYGRLLDGIEADPERALGERVSLPAREKAWVAVRSMLGVGG